MIPLAIQFSLYPSKSQQRFTIKKTLKSKCHFASKLWFDIKNLFILICFLKLCLLELHVISQKIKNFNKLLEKLLIVKILSHVILNFLQRLWPSLNYGLKQCLQENYTKEVNEAWKKVYFYVCFHMKRGMENPDLDFDSFCNGTK